MVQSVDFATFLGGNPAYTSSSQQAATAPPDTFQVVYEGQTYDIPTNIDLGSLGTGMLRSGGANFVNPAAAQDIDFATFLGGSQPTQQQEAPMVDLRGQGPRNNGGTIGTNQSIDFASFLGDNPAYTGTGTDAAPTPPPVSRDIVVPSAMPPTNPNTFSNPYVTTPPQAEITFMNLLGSIPNAPPPPNPYASTVRGIASLAKPDGSI